MRKVERIAEMYSNLQKEICQTLETTDGKALFRVDEWTKEIGRGVTCVMQDGDAIEKGGVNFSFVEGDVTPQMALILGEKASRYSATGISSIMHPKNPFAPIIHMNVRYFALDNGTEWFGGGIDLTPHYVRVDEAKLFHIQLKEICDNCHSDYYSKFKNWADDYFFIPHRDETRGIGGIFFDRLKPNEEVSFEQLFSFTQDLSRAYPKIYSTFLNQNRATSFTPEQKAWQELRRGRYVEFNLVYDRGTKFGFESNGNAESILVSLPNTASWEYKHEVKEGSAEELTQGLLKKGIDWINY